MIRALAEFAALAAFIYCAIVWMPVIAYLLNR
jgi:hypothetical protein